MKSTPFTQRWFSRVALQELDRRAVEEYHIPILVLMENAGRAVAEAAGHLLEKGLAKGGGVLVVCGPGNNGGDGLVAARHLANAGHRVQILLTAPPESFREAAAGQLAITNAMNLPTRAISPDHAEIRDWLVDANPADLVIDAIFGTGLSRPVAGLPRDIIAALNLAHHPTLAVDIPSGLDADSGLPLGIAIKATETVSFCGYKIGYATSATLGCWGKVTVADIGAPAALLQQLASPRPPAPA